MTPCDCTPTTVTTVLTTPCKYTGADIACVGIISGESIDSAIGKLADTICNLTNPAPELVLYSERALGSGSIGTSLVSITGTSYTVPIGGAGDYEITYVGEYKTPSAGTLVLRLYKGTSEYSAIVARTVQGAATTITPFTLFSSNITLLAGDTIAIRGAATASTYAQNAICKITKIS